MRVIVDGVIIKERRTVTITPPEGWHVFSGWSGDSTGAQTFEMTPRDRNGLIMMGSTTGRADVAMDDVAIEVRQFGAGPQSAERVAQWLGAVAPLMVRTTGVNP